ncbi:MAG: site-specific DNA-methyltransferase [Dehalococcoidia bacterium]|nr:site-specific DNA-methyltransferase [Dehalococcoidia bacterium]
MKTNGSTRIYNGDCVKYLTGGEIRDVALTFVDPPFRQGKEYRYFDDTQPEEKYWDWMEEVLRSVCAVTLDGGAVYFMQREKNAEDVLRVIRNSGWSYQNLIVWKKKTSAVPCDIRYAKQYQIIVFATKGERPRLFNKLRIDLAPAPEHKYARPNGVFLTDVWDDIRELTSGYFAGDEAIRELNGDRAHVQQSPVALLLRIVLSSTRPGDTVLDPFAGTGTTVVVASQLGRPSVGIEIDPKNVDLIEKRLNQKRVADRVDKYRQYYRFTPGLNGVWSVNEPEPAHKEAVDA